MWREMVYLVCGLGRLRCLFVFALEISCSLHSGRGHSGSVSYVYVNGKMRPVETIPGMGGKRDKGE
jgi:hypothetical protein